MLETLLSPVGLTSVLVAGSAAFAVSVVSGFLKDRTTLDKKRRQVDRILQKLRAEISERDTTIKQLQEELAQLQPQHDRLNLYYEEINRLQAEAERKELQEEEKHTPHAAEEEDTFARERHRITR